MSKVCFWKGQQHSLLSNHFWQQEKKKDWFLYSGIALLWQNCFVLPFFYTDKQNGGKKQPTCKLYSLGLLEICFAVKLYLLAILSTEGILQNDVFQYKTHQWSFCSILLSRYNNVLHILYIISIKKKYISSSVYVEEQLICQRWAHCLKLNTFPHQTKV